MQRTMGIPRKASGRRWTSKGEGRAFEAQTGQERPWGCRPGLSLEDAARGSPWRMQQEKEGREAGPFKAKAPAERAFTIPVGFFVNGIPSLNFPITYLLPSKKKKEELRIE